MAAPVRLNIDQSYVNGAFALLSTNVAGGSQMWWRALDTSQFKSINGDVGTTHAPAAPIIIGGAGVIMYHQGFLTIGGGFQTQNASGKRLVHNDNDYVMLGAAFSETLITPLSNAVDCSFQVGTKCGRFFQHIGADGLVNAPMNLTNPTNGARLICPIETRHGATLVSVTFYFTPASSHAGAGVPVSLPSFRVIKVDVFGNVTPLQSNTATTGWAGAGFVVYNPTPVSGTAWSTVQSFLYTCDAGVVIDKTQFAYFIEIQDESSTNSLGGNLYTAAVATETISDLRAW